LLNSPPEGLCNGNRQNRVFVADWGIDEQQDSWRVRRSAGNASDSICRWSLSLRILVVCRIRTHRSFRDSIFK